MKQLRNLENLNLRKNSEGTQTENIKSLKDTIEKIVKELKTFEDVFKNLYQIAVNDVAGIKSQKPRYKIIKK